jgi:hypothetical protein
MVLSHWTYHGLYGVPQQRAAMDRAHVVQGYLAEHGVPPTRISHGTFSDGVATALGTTRPDAAATGRVEVIVRDLAGAP